MSKKNEIQEDESKPQLTAKQKIKLAIENALTTGTFLVFTAMVASETISAIKGKVGDYKTTDQITENAKSLDADMRIVEYFAERGPLKSEYKRLLHNNNKPIYVNIGNSFSASEREMIISSLNYYEDVFKEINPKYRFKILNIPFLPFNFVAGQTTMQFHKYNIKADGVNYTRANYFNKQFLRNIHIVIDPESLTWERPLAEYVIKHEILHSFGFADVYQAITPVDHQNTFEMVNNFNFEMGILQPNDIAVLHSLYNQDLVSGDEEQNKIALEETKQKIENYKKFYAEKVKEFYVNKKKVKNFETITDEDLCEKPLSYTSVRYYSPHNRLLTFDTEKNEINYKIFDENNKFIYETTVPYVKTDDMVFVTNLKIDKEKHPKLPKSGVYNFAIANKGGKLVLLELEFESMTPLIDGTFLQQQYELNSKSKQAKINENFESETAAKENIF